jgi:hypothetical protein
MLVVVVEIVKADEAWKELSKRIVTVASFIVVLKYDSCITERE